MSDPKPGPCHMVGRSWNDRWPFPAAHFIFCDLLFSYIKWAGGWRGRANDLDDLLQPCHLMVLCITLLAGWSHSFVLFHQQLRWCSLRLKNKDPRVRCVWVWTKAPLLASYVILGKCLASLALSGLTCKVRVIKLIHWTALGIKWDVCMCVKPIAQCLVWSKC